MTTKRPARPPRTDLGKWLQSQAIRETGKYPADVMVPDLPNWDAVAELFSAMLDDLAGGDLDYLTVDGADKLRTVWHEEGREDGYDDGYQNGYDGAITEAAEHWDGLADDYDGRPYGRDIDAIERLLGEEGGEVIAKYVGPMPGQDDYPGNDPRAKDHRDRSAALPSAQLGAWYFIENVRGW